MAWFLAIIAVVAGGAASIPESALYGSNHINPTFHDAPPQRRTTGPPYKADLTPLRLSNPKRQQRRIGRVADVTGILGRRRELETGNGWAFYRLVELTVGGLRPNPTLVQRAAKVGYEPTMTECIVQP